MLLMVAAALALALNTTSTMLPPTQPGLSPDEGVFLQTDANDGSKVSYFIAQGARHAVQDNDLQAEMRINPLWPYRVAPRDEVLAFPEGSPIGNAPVGRLSGGEAIAEDQTDDAPVAEVEVAVVADTDEPEAAEAEQTYTVKRGDTLIGIAARFGVTEADLLTENNIPNRNRIYAGQVLTIG